MKEIKILTVGDGDLSFSLALKRAYSNYSNISITASTLLPSEKDLIHTYSNAEENLNELTHLWKENVLFGIDATKLVDTLHSTNQQKQQQKQQIPKYDIIMFNHPHLGDATLHESEKHHAQRHHALLCHYFHSAKQCIVQKADSGNGSGSGRIHVCLCGSQPQTWDIIRAAKRHGLSCTHQEQTSTPMHPWLFQKEDELLLLRDGLDGDDTTNTNGGTRNNDTEIIIIPSHVQNHYKAPRRYRNGKLGSKHFLGKYGYRHRRTSGDLFSGNELDMHVEQSINFVFEWCDNDDNDKNLNQVDIDVDGCHSTLTDPKNENCLECHICGMIFENNDTRSSNLALELHLRDPALPDIMIGDMKKNQRINNSHDKELDKNRNRKNHDGNEKVVQNICTTKVIVSDRHTNDINEKCKNEETNQNIHQNNHRRRHHHHQLEKEMKLAVATVTSEMDGKRLRWCCRQSDFPLSIHVKSKKICEQLIKSGRIYVNDYIVLDSSRILKTGDVVTFTMYQHQNTNATVGMQKEQDTDTSKKRNYYGVKIMKIMNMQDPSKKLIVAFKPVGVRTVGSFSSQTLEMIVASYMVEMKSCKDIICESITKLDTGCAGFCVLIASGNFGTSNSEITDTTTNTTTTPRTANEMIDPISKIISVTYKFTTLVHGSVPSNWDQGIYMRLPTCASRRWNNRQNGGVQSDEQVEEILVKDHVVNVVENEGNWVKVKCVQRLGGDDDNDKSMTPNLSTLVIMSPSESGRLSNTLCYMLRKVGYPVVNDRFCKQELAQLPRVMRNILKNKLCIGCYDIVLSLCCTSAQNENIKSVSVHEDPNSRTQCTYWQTICCGAGDTLDVN